jgi:hypothetical protein
VRVRTIAEGIGELKTHYWWISNDPINRTMKVSAHSF